MYKDLSQYHRNMLNYWLKLYEILAKEELNILIFNILIYFPWVASFKK